MAQHLGFTALADVAEALADDERDGRVIGGHMVALHAERWQLDLYRETRDADLGVRPLTVQTPALTDRLIAMGYNRTAGNRFERPLPNLADHAQAKPSAVIDILIPSYTSRVQDNQRFGDHLVTTQVPGLATAFQRPATDLELEVAMIDGERRTIAVRLPDEVGALTLKAMARTVRSEDRDAVDVWRMLEVCQAAGLTNVDFGADDEDVKRVLNTEFSRGGTGISDIKSARNLSTEATEQQETRIQALISRVVG